MKKIVPIENPDAYVDSLDGWQREQVTALRKAVRGVAALGEDIKWGHLVYTDEGPVLLIRAEANRVLFGFWRGQRLKSIEPRLKAGGKTNEEIANERHGFWRKAQAVAIGRLDC